MIASEKDILHLQEAGRRLARILSEVAASVRPGMTSEELDTMAKRLIEEGGDTPAFLGYMPEGSDRPYPGALCVSVNDEVVHGIPNESPRTLNKGDIVGLDLGLIHRGYVVDSAVTVPVGEVDEKTKALIAHTKQALLLGIAEAREGNAIGDIGFAIESFALSQGLGVVRELGGHGVGKRVHEEPHIPNFGKKGKGMKLRAGMVLAIEPMLNEGSDEVYLAPDGYTWKTADGKRSAHFEHTILVTEGDPEILTEN